MNPQVIGSCELLQHLQRHSQQRSVSNHGASFPVASETTDPACAFPCLDLLFPKQMGHDFVRFAFHDGMIKRKAPNTRNRPASTFDIVILRQPTRGFWHSQDTGTENEGPDEADANDDTPLCGPRSSVSANGDAIYGAE